MNTIDLLNAALIKKVAEIEGITPTSVRRVLNDSQNNDQVFRTFLFIEEEVNNAIEGVKLVRHIEKKMANLNADHLNQN